MSTIFSLFINWQVLKFIGFGSLFNSLVYNEVSSISHSSTFHIMKKINCTPLKKEREITICCTNYCLCSITWYFASPLYLRLMIFPQRQGWSTSLICLPYFVAIPVSPLLKLWTWLNRKYLDIHLVFIYFPLVLRIVFKTEVANKILINQTSLILQKWINHLYW